jgi:hypothetical protein
MVSPTLNVDVEPESKGVQNVQTKSSIQRRLFPDLDVEWMHVDLNVLHAKHSEDPIMSDVKAQCELVENARAGRFDVCTYGGFNENRDVLWFGRKTPRVHLGVDFNNLRVGQSVRAITSGRIQHVMVDKSETDGWGGRVIIRAGDRCILYGHLDPTTLPILDAELAAGEEVGKIAAPTTNGGWFPHLHLQYMTSTYVAHFKDLDVMDGYDTRIPEGVLDPMTIP